MFVVDFGSDLIELHLGQVGDDGSHEACLNSEDLRQNLVEASLVWTYMLKGGQEVEERRGREDIRRVWAEIKYT